MILYDFDYERPRTLKEAAHLLGRCGPAARVMAGGTDLLPNMRVAIARPATIIGLGGIAPEPPRSEPDGAIRIDALTRLATLTESNLIREKLPMLAESALAVGSNQIREMGTLGGNLCQDTRCLQLNQKHDFQFVEPCFKRGGARCYPFPQNKPDVCWSIYMSDIAPALIALGAELETVDESGGRRLAVEDLFTGSGLHPVTLKEGEIIHAIVAPPQPPGFGWGYHKCARRGGLEFALAVAAVAICLAADRESCTDARIVIGAVRERPVRAAAAERALVGSAIDPARLAAVAAIAAEEAKPLPHHGFTKSFIVDNLRVHLRRALARAVERACKAQQTE
jgi:4-hydroxybenzoyl-CoA reductase subunit beta